MRIRLCSLLRALIVLSAPAFAVADEPPALPTPGQIRSHYQEAEARWPTIPRTVLLAFVAAEDRKFFERPAQNSAITRQIGRWYLQPRSSQLRRISLSFVIGEALSHEEVLNWYANQIFLGQSCFGVTGGAMAYFGKALEDLRLDEIAYLAALPKAPIQLHPTRSYDVAMARRDFVLLEMLKSGFVSEEETAAALRTELMVREPLELCKPLE